LNVRPTVAADLVHRIALFEGLDPAALDGLLGIFRRVSFDAGECLARQGQPADSAFIIERGRAQVVTALPGGGECVVAELGPGSMLGETALLDSGVRSATVVAREAVDGYAIERDAFRMLLAQRNDAVQQIQRRITRLLCRRLRELNARILQCEDTQSRPAPALPPLAARREPCAYDWRAFLPLLPLFQGLRTREIDQLLGSAGAYDLPRRALLFEQGAASEACSVIVRGAVEISALGGGARRRIGILGPGRLCGILALIEGESHSMSAVVRERATIVDLPRARFVQLYAGGAEASPSFQRAINRELLQALARTNNHLTRLISQARIRGRRDEADSLQRALGAQDCAAVSRGGSRLRRAQRSV
jgi:CRP-like cAMP-binding protein